MKQKCIWEECKNNAMFIYWVNNFISNIISLFVILDNITTVCPYTDSLFQGFIMG
jgi:hypothetical protein